MVTANRRHPPGRSAPRPPTLSGQALGLERLDDVRPRTYALDVAPQLRPLAEVDFDMAGPAERWHVALGIHLVEVQAVGGLLGVPVHLDQLEFESGVAQSDVRGQRTGTRKIVELHVDLLGSTATDIGVSVAGGPC